MVNNVSSTVFHAHSTEEALRAFDVTLLGLTENEAIRRRSIHGLNELPKPPKPARIIEFLREFKSFFVYLLVAASGLSYFIGEHIDAAVIIAIVLANGVIGYLQRQKAERAIDALRDMVKKTAKVIRNGELTVIARHDIVPGDIITLDEGERVPADARLITTANLRVDESALTGESAPEFKKTEALAEQTPVADRINCVFMGTLVAAGEGVAVVIATGSKTEFGRIATSMRTIARERTHFEKRTDELALQMGMIAIIGDIITFTVGYFMRHMAFFDIFLFSIASMVSGVPEGLPAVVTIILATGAWRMAQKRAIVRRLAAVETLGVSSVIVSDKTGTLTQNSMTAEEIILGTLEQFTVTGTGWEPRGVFFQHDVPCEAPSEHPALRELLEIGTGISHAKITKKEQHYEPIGDPTEAAFVVLAEKAGIMKDAIAHRHHEIARIPFDHERGWQARLVSVRAVDEPSADNDVRRLEVMGAWERVLEVCTTVETGTEPITLTPERRFALAAHVSRMAKKSMRVLAVAWTPEKSSGIAGQAFLEPQSITGLRLCGIVGVRDPLRPDAQDAVLRAGRAGVRVVMQTGDHPATALAIAKEAGIAHANATEEHDVRTETQLAALNEKEFSHAVRTINVFARITPAMKLRIVQTLRAHGEIVAVTGDGVNDAPALKQADIGVSMGERGTSAAREASDIVLADDNFASIVGAIEEGRVAFTNVRKSSFYLISTNIAEDIAIIATILIGLPLPLLPIHILWLNLVTDGSPVIALAVEPMEQTTLNEPPRKADEPILSKDVIPFLGLVAVIMTVGMIGLFAQALPQGIDKARTVAFTAMALFQLFNAYNMRSLTRSAFSRSRAKGGWLGKALLLALLLQVAVLVIPALRGIFRLATLTAGDWVRIVLVTASVLAAGELYKLLRYGRTPRLETA